jgi:ABC-type lipoprotein release transport system permease subunit
VTAIRVRALADLRRQWRGTLVLVVLIGLAAGTVMAAAAGARRTASAYPRMRAAANAGDVLVNPDDGDTDFDAIEALPGVLDTARGFGHFLTPITPSGQPDFSTPAVPISSDGRLGYEIDRPVHVDGRLPDRAREDEAFLSRPLAERLDRGVGDELELYLFREDPSPPERLRFRVVGVGLFPLDALQDRGNEATAPLLMVGPAFHRAHADTVNFTASLVRLDDGPGTLDRFLVDARRTAGERVFLQTSRETTAKAQRALRPYATALGAFAVAAGVAAVLVLGQALARQLLADAGDTATLSALGMSTRQLVASVVLRASVMGAASALLGVGLAVAVSPLLPLDPARSLDPELGLDVDLPVLVLGAGAAVVLSTAIGAAVAWRTLRVTARTAPSGRPSRLTGLLAGLGAPPTSSTGLRMALQPGRGSASVPVRTTMVGAALGLGALVAAVTFGAGLDRLLDTPELYGWDWDAVVELQGEGPDEAAEAARRLDGLEGLRTVTPGSYGQVDVDGVSVATVGLGEGGDAALHPPLLAGRAARAPDEVVLGTTTLERIDREVGDRVEVSVGDEARSAQVVGQAVFPRLTAYPGADKTGLGDGAAMTVEGLAGLEPGATIGFFLVDVRDGAALDELRAAFRPVGTGVDESTPIVVTRPQRPDDLVSYEGVNRTPLALAALLAVLAGGATAHGLVLATRRRRHDLALLKTLGFTRRQVFATVAWQATVVAAVALVVGLPLGVALGRWSWAALADRLGTVAEPVTPLVAVALTVPAVVLLANLVALLPARSAARIRPAVALRAE